MAQQQQQQRILQRVIDQLVGAALAGDKKAVKKVLKKIKKDKLPRAVVIDGLHSDPGSSTPADRPAPCSASRGQESMVQNRRAVYPTWRVAAVQIYLTNEASENYSDTGKAPITPWELCRCQKKVPTSGRSGTQRSD